MLLLLPLRRLPLAITTITTCYPLHAPLRPTTDYLSFRIRNSAIYLLPNTRRRLSPTHATISIPATAPTPIPTFPTSCDAYSALPGPGGATAPTILFLTTAPSAKVSCSSTMISTCTTTPRNNVAAPAAVLPCCYAAWLDHSYALRIEQPEHSVNLLSRPNPQHLTASCLFLQNDQPDHYEGKAYAAVSSISGAHASRHFATMAPAREQLKSCWISGRHNPGP